MGYGGSKKKAGRAVKTAGITSIDKQKGEINEAWRIAAAAARRIAAGKPDSNLKKSASTWTSKAFKKVTKRSTA